MSYKDLILWQDTSPKMAVEDMSYYELQEASFAHTDLPDLLYWFPNKSPLSNAGCGCLFSWSVSLFYLFISHE